MRLNLFEIDAENVKALRSGAPLAPARYRGLQSGCGPIPTFDLWDLTANIPGHPAGSTVSSQTLLAAGFSLPPIE